jgi:hypothetical protein
VPQRQKASIRVLRVGKGASLKQIYAKARREFTAADLQKFTEVEEGIPAEKVLAKLEALARAPVRRRKKTQ